MNKPELESARLGAKPLASSLEGPKAPNRARLLLVKQNGLCEPSGRVAHSTAGTLKALWPPRRRKCPRRAR